jgi:hypothetical protein
VDFIYDGVRLKPSAAADELLFQRLRAIAERSAARQADLPPFSEADLYDDHGLPG